MQQHAPLTFGQVVPDHHIDHAELVFNGYEDHAAGGLRPLATDHQASDADQTIKLHLTEFA